jgi:hypothetical protein
MKGNDLMKQKIAILVLICFTIWSCEDEPKEIVVFNVENEYVLRLSQILNAEGGKLALEIVTDQPQECENLRLNYEVQESMDNATVWVKDFVLENNVCVKIDAPQPVSTKIPIQVEGPKKNVQLIFTQVGNVSNNGDITKSGASYKILMNKGIGLYSENNTLNLIEKDTYWGQIWLNGDITSSQYLKIESILATKKTTDLSDGNYTYFNVNQGKVSFPSSRLIKASATYFAFKSTASELQKLLSDLRTISGIHYSITSFSGDQFLY